MPLRLWIASEAAKALDYAHRAKGEDGKPLSIVHRDVSPQNVLLGFEGEVKVADFGIARADEPGLGRGEDPKILRGKYAYMSPEQARGEPVDARSDVFAAGIVLYELVCARPLFHGKGKEALEMVKSGAIPRPRDWAPELPESLERTILKALAFHRADRFQTARDLQHELARFRELRAGGADDGTGLRWSGRRAPLGSPLHAAADDHGSVGRRRPALVSGRQRRHGHRRLRGRVRQERDTRHGPDPRRRAPRERDLQ